MALVGIMLVSAAAIARADSTVITSGNVDLAWDGSPSGIQLDGSNTHLIAEDIQSPPDGLHAGDVENLSGTVHTSTMNHPVSVTVNGTTYSSVWIQGQFVISATPFTVSREPEGTFVFFSTPFTMTGQYSGYSDQAMTNRVFTVTLSGRGVATIGPMREVGDDSYVMSSGGLVYQFTASAPAPWSSTDVGTVGQSGVSSFDRGTYYVSGGGSDIWGTADSFQFLNRTLDGDGQIIARVSGISDTNTFAKAGIMLRDSLSANAAQMILDLRPTNGIEFMTRSRDGAATTYISGDVQATPWLRLIRSGTTVTASVSADGASWRTVGSTSFAAPAGIFVGLAVTSHDTSQLNTATFEDVSVTAATPSSGPGNIVIYASDIASAGVHGSWATVADATAAAGIKLMTPDNGGSNTENAAAFPADYVDATFTAPADTQYTIWLRLQAVGNSKWNDSVWVQFSDAQVGSADVYRIGSTNGLLVNLASDSAATSLNGWGWCNTAYWLSQQTRVTFASSGMHTLRIQVREDGVQFDQIVLSPTTYATSAPGPIGGDHTIVSK